eukprot:CAMPEP_0113417316 /NCGR_PEP_ID=MMETSP0013_2-20120614/25584_1 /TAXON_ID=2843 ORGANISM="Skeletonema costatum, Strain 1716" /NCGR_SAMPLE_ID=MMETSP0013_2 /ASSEMBLY_ACC=CAM_ASM_000158 /LENGTH=402 /DNA_ID=CAMNT_0000304429 /DNA_START=153 /DNA_END=1361 /DNA_ORIENTATION=+ /assembly_acc=CAM_ASM_000158
MNGKYSRITLEASAENNNDGDISNEFKEVNNEQHDVTNNLATPPFLSWGYSLAAVMNVAAAMSLLWGSCASKSSISSSAASSASIQLLSTSHHYWDPTFTSSILSYLLLGAGTCQLLSNITKRSDSQDIHHQDQQQQQLRQRLTIGTFLFSLIGLFSIPGEASYHNQPLKFATSLVLCQLSKLITAATSFIGWEDTIPGGFGSSSSSRGKNILREIINGLKSTWNTMPISDTHPASFYRTFFIFCTLGNVALNVPNLVFYLREGVSWCSVPVSSIVSSIGRGCLLSMILFVLKEEHAGRSSGDEDVVFDENGGGLKEVGSKRKGSGTFVVLNMLVGLWAVGVGISQGFAGGIPFNLRRAADKFLFGLLFLNNGVLTQLTRMGLIKDRDEIDPDAEPILRIGL